MAQESGTNRPASWDISRLPRDCGEQACSTWARTHAARVLGAVLAAQPDFRAHVDEVHRGSTSAEEIVRRYVPRDGPRRTAFAVYLNCAVGSSDRMLADKLTNIGCVAYWEDAPLEPGAPRRAVRSDAEVTVTLGALAVARRGASRCASPGCGQAGALLASDRRAVYCTACEDVSRRGGASAPRSAELLREAERSMWDGVIATVIPAVPDRPRERRIRRASA